MTIRRNILAYILFSTISTGVIIKFADIDINLLPIINFVSTILGYNWISYILLSLSFALLTNLLTSLTHLEMSRFREGMTSLEEQWRNLKMYNNRT